jgi:hypothetical protein
MQAAAATIAAKPYLSHARVAARSFAAHHPGIPFFVLLADRVDGWFDPDREPYRLVHLQDLHIPNLERLRLVYDQQPFSYALTPYLLAHLLALGARRVLFFKQESIVLGSHAEVLDLLDRHPIVLTPHLTAPLTGSDRLERERAILQSGVFNVGLLGVSAGAEAERFLDWWKALTYDHCMHAIAEGMHYEQRWLDLVPAFFDGAHLLRDTRFNVAHWNLPDRQVEIRDGTVLVDGRRCCLFRFSGYEPERPDRVTKYFDRLTTRNVGPAAAVFARFRESLLREGYEETKGWPYAYATFDNGVPIPAFARTLARRLGPSLSDFGDPRRTVGDRTFFAWLTGPVDEAAPGQTKLARFWFEVYRERPDLQATFPDVLSADRERFLTWTATCGVSELNVDPAFLARRW